MKHKLLDLIKAGREKEESDLVPYVNDAPPDEAGSWSAKDQLAHLTAWRQVAVAEMEAVRTGAPGPDVSDDDDVENAKIYSETHQRAAALIRKAGKRSWDQFEAAVEACSDTDLAKPRLRRPDQPLWQAIPNHTYNHLAEHLAYWHGDRGDSAAAEKAAQWAYALATSTFPDNRERGVASYNLGCFYAKRGRAAEALPYLREGIERFPDLRNWAKEDTDLDPIRTTPELANLLG
jgi:tetratricopeptide (TPR) repeat protein